uniref:Peptidase M41 domain-containing protein n=1 Tax=Oryza meridionalis TaxID=40149 RepID=A0A0E0C440_9ORYZ
MEQGRGQGSGVGGSSSGSGGTEEEGSIAGEKALIPYTVPPPLDRPSPNYTVVDLEGTQVQVRNRWRKSVLDYRLWCYNTSDARYEFGHPYRRCCVLPPKGHFLVYMHYKGKWLCALIDGISGYLNGYVTRSIGKTDDLRIMENGYRGVTEPEFIEHAKKLPWDGAYVTAHQSKCGYNALLKSFLLLHRFVDGQEPKPLDDEVREAGQIMIVHFPEAAKNDSLYLDKIHKNFRAAPAHVIGKRQISKARSWSKNCDDAKPIFQGGGAQSKIAEKGRGDHDATENSAEQDAAIADAKEFLEEVRLIHRTSDSAKNLFLLKDMPVHPSINGPVDVAWTENELRRSRDHGLDDPSWGFLTEQSPKFPPANNNEQNQPTLIENAYMTFSECDEYSGSPDHQEEMSEESVGYKQLRLQWKALKDRTPHIRSLPNVTSREITRGHCYYRLIAYHESGHAIVALHTQGAHPIHQATVLPHGLSVGMVTQVASPGNTSISKQKNLARIDVCFGGAVAEELLFGEHTVTAGAKNDLFTAKELAQKLTSDTVDRMHLEKWPSVQMQAMINAEVLKLLGESHERVKRLLKKHEMQLQAVANALLEKEILNADEIIKVVQPYKREPQITFQDKELAVNWS